MSRVSPLVTKESLASMIHGTTLIFVDQYPLTDDEKIPYVIGKALAAIYRAQTQDEQSNSTARLRNGVGFSKNDARTGSIGARMFNARMAANCEIISVLDAWLVEIWSKPAKDGYPRICRYASQLNDIAMAKQRLKMISESEPFKPAELYNFPVPKTQTV